MRIGIIADSACDLPSDLIERENITILPVTVQIGQAVLADVRNEEATMSFLSGETAARAFEAETTPFTVQQVHDLFLEKLVHDYDFVFCITTTRTRSGIHDNAVQASYTILNDYRQTRQAAGNNTPFSLRVIDSQNVFCAVGVLAVDPTSPFTGGAILGDRVRIVTGTLGKSLGGAMGGFVAASQPIVDLLRQRARPYLFSNSLAPAVAAGSIAAIRIAEKADDRRQRLSSHAKRFRAGLEKAGFELIPGETPIIPVMLHDARLAQDMAAALDERGVYVAGFFFPVVPKGKARIRTQMSAALTEQDVEFAISAFADAGRQLGLI